MVRSKRTNFFWSPSVLTSKIFDALTNITANHFQDYKNDKSELVEKFKNDNPKDYNTTVELCNAMGKLFEKMNDPRDYLKIFRIQVLELKKLL